MSLALWFVLYRAGWALLQYWDVRTRRRYFDAFDGRGEANLSLRAELGALKRDPVGTLATSPRRSVKRIVALHQRQQDPELERLRQQCVRPRVARMVFFWGGMALLTVSAITHWL